MCANSGKFKYRVYLCMSMKKCHYDIVHYCHKRAYDVTSRIIDVYIDAHDVYISFILFTAQNHFRKNQLRNHPCYVFTTMLCNVSSGLCFQLAVHIFLLLYFTNGPMNVYARCPSLHTKPTLVRDS